MDPAEIQAYLATLDGCSRKGSDELPAWYVDHTRLVARLSDPTTLVIRMPMDRRDDFLASHPDGFGVPPRFEAHHKIEAYLDRAEADAVREALRIAWAFQRSW